MNQKIQLMIGVMLIIILVIPAIASAEPWWNTSWNYKKQINITNNNLSQVLEQNYTVNVTFNHSQLVQQGKSTANGSDVRILWYDSTPWWNSSWNYRKKLTITNNNLSQVLEQNYTVNITLDTTGSKFVAAGNDTRIVWWNGTNNIELDRVNTTAFSAVNTSIWFKLQKNISANSWDDNYYVYYGNPSAGAAPANGSNVFISYADFSSSAGWTTVSNGDDSIVNQRIEFQSNDAEGSYIYKDLGFNTGDFQLDYEVYISSANLNPNAIVGGFSDSVGKYSVWINGIYAYVYAHDVGGQRFGLGVRKNSVQTDITITTWSWGGSIWYYLRLRRVGSTAYFYIYSDAQRTSLLASTSFPDASTTGFRYKYGYTGAWAGYGSEVISGYVDTMQLRKYLSPEPSASLGAEQGQSRYVELDRVNTTAFNNATNFTVLWFKLQTNIPAGGSDANYSLYYGNPSAGAAPANGSNVYMLYDDFTGSLNIWTTQGAVTTWAVESGELSGTKSAVADSMLTANIDSISNFEVEVECMLKSPLSVNQQCGLVGRFQDAANFYAARWYITSGGKGVMMSEWVGDVHASLGSTTHTFNADEWHTVKFRIWQQSLYMWTDGAYSLSNTDDSFSTGKIGVYLAEDPTIHNHYDNLKLRKYLSPEPSAVLLTEECYDCIPPQITISSPLNQTYSTTSVDLNYSANDTSLYWVGYSLDGQTNITLMIGGWVYTQENSSSSSCDSNIQNCSKSMDNDWSSYANVVPAAPDGYIYENYSISSGVINEINLTAKIYTGSSASTYILSAYNYSSSVWEQLWRVDNAGITENKTLSVNYPNYLSNKLLQIRHRLTAVFGTSNVWLYESKLETFHKNTTLSISTDGSHNVTVYANDTAGNQNSSRVFFTVDTTPPQITIQSPLSQRYSTGSIDYNITANEALGFARVSIDSGPNMSMANDTLYHYYNLSSAHASLGSGHHSAIFFVQDLFGNQNSSSISFMVGNIYVSGYALYSKTGLLMSNANVTAIIRETGVTVNTTTDSQGSFELWIIAALQANKEYNLVIKVFDSQGRESYLIEKFRE